MDQPTAEETLRRLEPLVGEWTLSAVGADGVAWPGGGHASFVWHDSGAHLVQRTRMDLPQAPSTVAIIGCDGANDTFTQVYADDRGVSRVYAMSIGDGEWRLWREGEPFDQRFVATFSADGDTITGRWERTDERGELVPDFDLVYRRVRD